MLLVLEVKAQLIVPVQLLADKVVEPPEQILVFVAVSVGVSPKPPTVIVLWAVAEHTPFPQLKEYVVVTLGVTTISDWVEPVDQRIFEVHPVAVSVTGSPPQVTVLEALMTGEGKGFTVIVSELDTGLTHEPAEQVAE
jgi:hypothetical protein